MKKWREFLLPYSSVLFDETFMNRWGDLEWSPINEDRTAAARLSMEMASRITTQRLDYLDGTEKAALNSVYQVFPKSRALCDEYPEAFHFESVVWHVLNTYVRPFTAKWHPVSEKGGLDALDTTDSFREELASLQTLLQTFADLLLHLRLDQKPPPRPGGVTLDRVAAIENEMSAELPWGIPAGCGGNNDDTIEAINNAEKTDIQQRRRHYTVPPLDPFNKKHAVALALSGGGIRSATFSLGVLVALARRGLMPQFDYLSTVSGGGYLGSFLTTYLNTKPPAAPAADEIGLRPDDLPFRRRTGEAEALRHLRHHSKYLATGSLLGQLTMMCAQLFGMAINGLAIVFIAIALGLLEYGLRHWSWLDGQWQPVTTFFAAALGVWAVVALLLMRFRLMSSTVDKVTATLVGSVLALLIWRLLDYSHQWPSSLLALGNWHWSFKATILVVCGSIPVIASTLSNIPGKVFHVIKVVLVLLSSIAAPLFFFGVCLLLYEWLAHGDKVSVAGHEFKSWEFALALALALGVVYYFLLNINLTSPHRHYRNKLAEAYLIQPAAAPAEGRPFDKNVRVQLSGMTSARAPYHLINGALNVPGSKNSGMQGRLTDFFLFSRRYCGSPLTGYCKTVEWEAVDQHLDLGTAMAISAAAAAPQMGLGTIKKLSFWLALLNVRLGYWVRVAGKRGRWHGGAPGLSFLLQEMLGNMNEKRPWLNVSDGGHLENLGVYELLRRRCKFIVAVDGEQDGSMTFAALTTLQRLAYIDLGIKIDINLDDLRLNEKGYSRSHFRFCRIHYPARAAAASASGPAAASQGIGYLLYLKLSLTGNEGEFLRRYRLDEPVFPHHSTADQFFSEAQFEAYRSLGEHVGDKLFMKALIGNLPDDDRMQVEQWLGALGENLLEPKPAR
ncbi:MAG: patatin-like phospholipase family protein [Prosthecobacter sp.]|nr:patatin-like phospholipase family protein [Prosthecobacter sp.]